jgi:hypothetical protein
MDGVLKTAGVYLYIDGYFVFASVLTKLWRMEYRSDRRSYKARGASLPILYHPLGS